MTYSTRLKLLPASGGVEILCEVLHPMVRDGANPNYITQMVFRRNGNVEAEFLLGQFVSRHPVIGTFLESPETGDVISVSWQDLAGNRGQAAVTTK